ncbi:hypothetical protein CLV62_12238 [Dysgonomonas alginatilytica]|uniref:Uncharacterized protein n=1 Tax=Dysgonomonas alginatilytica TaxID=1605892 RepID=A0A2V3PLH0_9BACT|nr:hypothetical protein [Dysgonomonas alginatilytica]PXV62085.1 hypothetical protein CLV62_12238 [Dysgonomonas alginatilytica]
METITMKGFDHQKQIDALTEALGHLQKAYSIIEGQGMDSKNKMPRYYESWFEAESGVGSIICYVSDAIGTLVAEDISDVYLAKI